PPEYSGGNEVAQSHSAARRRLSLAASGPRRRRCLAATPQHLQNFSESPAGRIRWKPSKRETANLAQSIPELAEPLLPKGSFGGLAGVRGGGFPGFIEMNEPFVDGSESGGISAVVLEPLDGCVQEFFGFGEAADSVIGR